MLKKISKLIILCALVFGLMWFIEGKEVQAASTIVVTDQKEGNFSYKEEPDSLGVKSITITGYDDTKADVAIPEKINGLPVTKIGANAFVGSGLTSITIPASMTSIGDSAFRGAYSLTQIELPNTLTSIGQYAFSGASKLTQIKLPNTLTSIGSDAFAGSGLTSITIPASMTSIDDSAFYGASKLTQIELPNTLTSIGNSAFRGASSLTQIKLPNTLTSIGQYAFYGSGLTSITIPASMTSIGIFAFSGASKLTQIELPNTLTSIGQSAFSGASSLTQIELPNTLTSIGQYAFNGSGLTSITIPASMTSIGEGAFYGASKLTQIELPNTLTSIGYGAFNGSGLTSITIPASMTSIGYGTFAGASKLTQIKLPNTLTSIGSSAFNGASSLTQIELPNTLKSIGFGAFDGSGLTSITIPESMKSIGEGAFYGASKLTQIELPNTLTGIGASAFSGSGLTSITIPASMTSIGYGVFSRASKLTQIELPNTLTSIGEYAFSGSGLTSITIPESMTSIGEYAFNGSRLASITILARMTKIESLAFPDLKNVTVYAYKDSSAETYATNRVSDDNWRFVALSDVTFNSNGGSAVSKETIESGTVMKEPTAPTRVNHRFESWYVDAALTKEFDFTKPVTQDLTLYAKWIPTSEVTYDSNQGSTVPKETVDTGKLATKPSNPTRANHRVEGWYTDTALTIPWDFATDKVTSDMTLYAKWLPTSEVTYDSNQGSTVPKETVDTGTVATKPSNPTRANHRVEGWYTDTALTIPWDFATDKVTSDMTLYAKWLPTSEVTYDSNQGSTVLKETVDTGKLATKPSNPTRANHRFESWYEDAALTIPWDFATDKVTSDMTLYAKWLPTSEVTYDSNQGSTVPKETVDTGTVATKPSNPTKANHRFESWYEDAALTKEFDFTKPVTQDLTLYAKWVHVPNVAPPAEILDLSNIGDSSTGIQGIVSPNSYIQIVLNGTELANGRADNEGRFNIEIPNLVAGTELKMIVTNRFGSQKTTFLKVVDQTPPKVTVKPFSDKDTKITGKTEPKAKVKIYINGKLVKTITADEKGNYSYTVPKKKAGTVIKVIATDQAGNATTKTLKVVDKTAPAKPTVKIPTMNTTTLTGKAEPGSTVYVYKNNRVIAKAKSDEKGNYSLKIPKQKRGTILTLIARDQAKNTSKKTNTKVKKA